jgi:bifunctional UDP-N-acetylglucosamine pyrophosphorylase/glucosamine-1-phosphate N-acetyltransferase
VAGLEPARIVVVVGHQADEVRSAVLASGLPVETVVQAEQRGTGHAAQCAVPALGDFDGDVLILYGDVPLVTTATLPPPARHAPRRSADVTLLTMRFADPTGYGRILRDAAGRVRGIVEHRDASPEERAITEVNPGLYCVRADVLVPLLGELRADNAQGELYLTDVVGLAARAGRTIASVELERPEEVAGINTRAELAQMEATLRDETTRRWMDAGVTFEDPATAYVGPDVTIGRDTVIGPNVVLRGKTRIGEGCRLDGTAFLVDTTLGDRVHLLFACSSVGRRRRRRRDRGSLRATSPRHRARSTRAHRQLRRDEEGGGRRRNEGEPSHVPRRLRDRSGHERGAGTITCNYDGSTGKKSKTTIGARVQIGSDTQLVAPVTVHDDAYVGAGTTVTRDVPAGALVVTRTPPRVFEGWVTRRPRDGEGVAAAGPASAKAAKKDRGFDAESAAQARRRVAGARTTPVTRPRPNRAAPSVAGSTGGRGCRRAAVD